MGWLNVVFGLVRLNGIKDWIGSIFGVGQGLGILLFRVGVSGIEDTMVQVIWNIDAEELRGAKHAVLFT